MEKEQNEGLEDEAILEGLMKRENLQKSKERKLLEGEWNKLSEKRQLELLIIEIVKKKEKKDQLESYMLLKKVEKLLGKVEGEQVEEVSEVGFQLLRNMANYHPKYEARLTKVMHTLLKLNKPLFNKKLGQKMKEQGLMGQLMYLFRDNQDMCKVFRGVVEKTLKEQVLVPKRENRNNRFYREYMGLVDQQMVDTLIMPLLVKLLRRSEANVYVLLEYLQEHHHFHRQSIGQGWFNQQTADIVLDVFTYANDTLRPFQLKCAQILCTHTHHPTLVSQIATKILSQNNETKKLNYFQLLSHLVRDQTSGEQVVKCLQNSVAWMTLEDNLQYVDNITTALSAHWTPTVHSITQDNPLFLKHNNNKVQKQVVAQLFTLVLRLNPPLIHTPTLTTYLQMNVGDQLKEENLNKLVTNYPLLLAGLSLATCAPQTLYPLHQLIPQLFTPSVFMNNYKFYQKVTEYEVKQWVDILFYCVNHLDIKTLSLEQLQVMAHSLLQSILHNHLNYHHLCINLNHLLNPAGLLQLVIIGVFLVHYYQTVQYLGDQHNQQKINKLLQTVNKNSKGLEPSEYSVEWVWMYLKVNKCGLPSVFPLEPPHSHFLHAYFLAHLNDHNQHSLFHSLIKINHFQHIFSYKPLFTLSSIDNPHIISQIFNNPTVLQHQNHLKTVIQSQTNILKSLHFNYHPVAVVDQEQLYEEYKKEQEKGQEVPDFFDEHQLKRHQRQEFKKKLSYFQGILCEYIEMTLDSEEGQDLFFKHIYPNLRDLIKEDEVFNGVARRLLVELFSHQPYLAPFKYTLSQYVIGMKDYQLQMNQQQNQQVNHFLRIMNTQIAQVHSSQWLCFFYSVSQYVIQSDDSEINSKQQAIGIMNQIVVKERQLSGQSVDIVLQQANSLSVFKESYILLEAALQQMSSEQQQKYIKHLLNQLLSVSDSAQLMFLKAALQFQGFQDSLDIDLKVRVCTVADFSPQVQSSAAKAVGIIQQDNYTLDNIQQLNVKDLLINNRQHWQEWLHILLARVGGQPLLIHALFHQTFTQVPKQEDSLLFYIDLVKVFMQQVPKDFIIQSIQVLIGECCKYEEQMQQEAVDCGIHYIQQYIQQEAQTKELLEVLDGYLGDNTTVHQQVQTSAMVLLGSCGVHLKEKYLDKMQQLSEKIVKILVESSHKNTQLSMAKCLPNMVIFFPQPHDRVVQCLQQLASKGLSTNRLQGLGYMVASFIKGIGVGEIEHCQLMATLPSLPLLSKLHLINALQEILQKLLEPYVEKLLVHIMQGFGDTDQSLRQLSLECAKNCMNNLSAFGVKRVLPVLLKELEEGSGWRSKIAKIWALGNMAFCSPKQLSKCLPIIVPKLSEQLTDTHPQIRQGANEALKVIGSTIKNPEISEIIEILIKSLSDPFYENQKGLNVLLKTTFVHYIDIPALSLVVPIIEYALRSRDSEQKQDGARLIGTISTLIKDSKDLIPYLETLLNGLLIALNDPISEIRSMAAKATGVLAKKLGMEHVDPLLNRLYAVLDNQDSTSVERAGSAQGLAETYGQMGQEYFNYILPLLIEKQQNNNPRIKEGYLGIFMYLHLVMEDGVEYYLQEVLDSVVAAISDSDEQVRGLGQRVLKAFIKTYGERQSDILLERVNEGLFSNDYMKRLACTSLLGDLIPILKKTSNTKSFYNSLVSIYILRGDPHQKVITEATNVWKAQVDNTPKTLKSQLGQLLVKLGDLLMKQEDIAICAQQALEEFSAKYGEAWIIDIADLLLNSVKDNIQHLNQQVDSVYIQQLRGVFEVLSVFYSKCQRDSVVKSKDHFIDIIHSFQKELLGQQVDIDHQEKQFLILAMVQAVNVFLERMANVDLVQQLLEPYLQDLEHKGEQSIISTFLQESGKKVRKHVIPRVFECPLSQVRIETITNNAQELARDLYTPATEGVIGDLFMQLADPHLQNQILYCLQLLSVHLDSQKACQFLDDSLDQLRHLQQDNPMVQQILEILSFFFNKGDFQIQDQASDVMELLIPILLQCEQPQTISLLQSTMKAILTVRSKQESFNMMHSLVTNFQVILNDQDEEEEEEHTEHKYILGLNTKDCLEPYIGILVSSLAYGSLETIEVSIDFYQLLCKYVKQEFLKPALFQLVGPLVRAINYKTEPYLKIKLLHLLLRIYSLGLNISQYNVPLHYSFFKGLRETHDSQMVKIYIKLIIHLIKSHVDPLSLYHQAIKEFINTKNQNFIQLIYNIFKKKAIKKMDKQIYNDLSKFLLDSNNDQLLYKNVKIAREKGKILAKIMNTTNNEELGNTFIVNILQKFNKSKMSQDKVEEVLHFQYLYIIELIAFIYISKEEIELKVEKSLQEMIEQTTMQLNNHELVDTLCVEILRALAENEDNCKGYFTLPFMQLLSNKWADDNLITVSLERIKTLLDE